MDIGITRGEIDYVASSRNTDPRGIRSAGWCWYLAAVDGRNWTRPAASWRRCRLPVWVTSGSPPPSRPMSALPLKADLGRSNSKVG